MHWQTSRYRIDLSRPKVMGIVKPKLAGRADMGKVSAAVKAKLTQA